MGDTGCRAPFVSWQSCTSAELKHGGFERFSNQADWPLSWEERDSRPKYDSP